MDQGTGARNIVYLTECFPIIHKALGSIPHKLDMVVHTCNPLGRNSQEEHTCKVTWGQHEAWSQKKKRKKKAKAYILSYSKSMC